MNSFLTDRRRSWLSLAALFVLLLVLAALRPLAVPDEGRYGEIGRWMLVSGDWMTPRLNGVPFFHKPPYLYWLEAISLATFGVHPWAARLIPALHAGLMLLALYLAARRISNEATARRAALMLGTSFAFLLGGQYINHDMLVASWIGIAIWCFALSFAHGERPHAHLARLGFVACALGVLSKMLIGVALPGLVLLIWLAWTRQLRKILHLPWFSGLALFALIAVPWFVAEARQFPGMFDYMFMGQQFGRYTGTGFNNALGWWFYLPAIALLMFPWVFFALYQGLRQLRGSATTSAAVPRQWQALCWIWILAILVFFSIPQSKIVGYILPVMPPLALLAAMGWDGAWGQRAWAGKLFAGFSAMAIALAVGGNTLAGFFSAKNSTRELARTLACQAQPQDTVYVSGGFPYDLPFYAQTSSALVVLQDWPKERASAGDNWRRELFEGADFDAAAARVLQTPDVLAQAGKQSGNWLVASVSHGQSAVGPPSEDWEPIQQTEAWALFRSGAKGPVAPKYKGLSGCDYHRGQ